MTTPSEDGQVPVPTPPEAVPPAVTPAQPAAQDDALKDFITELSKQLQLGFEPATVRKAIVVSHESTATPPTCTIQFPNADGSVGESIPGVRYYDHYTPVANDTVHIMKLGSAIWALGQINDATQGGTGNGWATAGSGVEYRKVVDNGDFKIQFKGTWTGSGTSLFTLPTGFRPSVTRMILCGRDGNAAGIRVQITTGGVCTLVGGDLIPDTNSTTPGATGSTTPGATGSTDPGGGGGTTGGPSTANTANGGVSHSHNIPLPHSHSHGGAVSNTSFADGQTGDANAIQHSHSMQGHTHTFGGGDLSHTHTSAAHTHTSAAHTHTVTLALPGNVYFDGAEFFL